METEIRLIDAEFKGEVSVYTINGLDIKAENTFETPDNIQVKENRITARNHTLNFSFEPHSITALVSDIA
jgi:alpha-L-arabinofuranosidase